MRILVSNVDGVSSAPASTRVSARQYDGRVVPMEDPSPSAPDPEAARAAREDEARAEPFSAGAIAGDEPPVER